MSLLKPSLLVLKFIMNCSSVSFLCIFEIALQNANFEIVNVSICIEMQWLRKNNFLSDRVCVIIKSLSEISVC